MFFFSLSFSFETANTDPLPQNDSNVLNNNTIGLITFASPNPNDSLNLLVKNLNKQIMEYNMQLQMKTEPIEENVDMTISLTDEVEDETISFETEATQEKSTALNMICTAYDYDSDDNNNNEVLDTHLLLQPTSNAYTNCSPTTSGEQQDNSIFDHSVFDSFEQDNNDDVLPPAMEEDNDDDAGFGVARRSQRFKATTYKPRITEQLSDSPQSEKDPYETSGNEDVDYIDSEDFDVNSEEKEDDNVVDSKEEEDDIVAPGSRVMSVLSRKCELCGRELSSIQSVRRHLENFHKVDVMQGIQSKGNENRSMHFHYYQIKFKGTNQYYDFDEIQDFYRNISLEKFRKFSRTILGSLVADQKRGN